MSVTPPYAGPASQRTHEVAGNITYDVTVGSVRTALTDPASIRRYLEGVGLSTAVRPPRAPPQFEFAA